jgi:hypothetical protein
VKGREFIGLVFGAHRIRANVWSRSSPTRLPQGKWKGYTVQQSIAAPSYNGANAVSFVIAAFRTGRAEVTVRHLIGSKHAVGWQQTVTSLHLKLFAFAAAIVHLGRALSQ